MYIYLVITDLIITKKVINILEINNMNLQHCRGQSYDIITDVY